MNPKKLGFGAAILGWAMTFWLIWIEREYMPAGFLMLLSLLALEAGVIGELRIRVKRLVLQR
jgi:hypothetical protein